MLKHSPLIILHFNIRKKDIVQISSLWMLVSIFSWTSLVHGSSLDRSSFTSNMLKIHTINYPPFLIQKDISSSLVTPIYARVFEGTGFSYNFSFRPLPRVNLIISEGRWCVTNVLPVKKAPQVQAIKLPLTPLQQRIYRLAKNGEFNWRDLKELKGKKIALLRNRILDFDKSYLNAGMTVVKTNNIKQGFSLLLLKRVDFVLSDNLSAKYAIDQLSKNEELIQASDNILSTFVAKLWFNLKCPNAKAAYHMLKQKYPNE